MPPTPTPEPSRLARCPLAAALPGQHLMPAPAPRPDLVAGPALARRRRRSACSLSVYCGRLLVWRWRQRRLSTHARYVSITPPPEVDPAGAMAWWANLYELLHPEPAAPPASTARRTSRMEYRWVGRQLTIGVWIPGTVPAEPDRGRRPRRVARHRRHHHRPTATGTAGRPGCGRCAAAGAARLVPPGNRARRGPDAGPGRRRSQPGRQRAGLRAGPRPTRHPPAGDPATPRRDRAAHRPPRPQPPRPGHLAERGR